MADCYLCKDAGRKGSVAHRIVSGKGVCRDHYAGSLMPGQPISVGTIHESEKENAMPFQKRLDIERIKRLQTQGLHLSAIAREMEASPSTIFYHLKKLGLKANPKGKKNGDALATHTPRAPKLSAHRRTAKPAAKPDGASPWANVIEDLERQRDKLQAAIDALEAVNS